MIPRGGIFQVGIALVANELLDLIGDLLNIRRRDTGHEKVGIKVAAVGITGISLLVAGIGIMNIMLVSVTERTREIGVRRAIGAKKSQILSQFLIEAIILSVLGGLIGVALGVTIPLWLSKVMNLPAAVPLWSIVLGLLFCAFVGIVFGLWPAVRAARLDPVEALRHE